MIILIHLLVFEGTMDISATKLFGLHIESLLPPTSIELDLVQNIQVAALLGIGLVYQGTAHRHIAEALLSEIGKLLKRESMNIFKILTLIFFSFFKKKCVHLKVGHQDLKWKIAVIENVIH